MAQKLGCESIAFPLIATGVYGFPKAEALQIAISVFSGFLAEEEMQITMVVFDEESFVLSGKIFSDIDEFIDRNYVDTKAMAEYGFGSAMASMSMAMTEPVGHGRKNKGLFEKFLSGHGAGRRKEAACYEALREEAEACESEADAEEAAPAGEAPGAVPALERERTLDELMSQVAETWQESLFRLIDEKGYTDTEVYKRANVDRKLFSKIRSNTGYQPKKITAVAFALALRLSLDETKDLIGRAGYALSPSSRFDLIIEYFIRHEVYDTYTINLALFEHEQPLLGE